jgi:hypothetical protein
MTLKPARFSFIESLTKERRDPHRDQHYQQIFDDLKRLEDWMRDKKIENNWDLQQKLAFLRNVESAIRTGTAVRRTQLSWFTLTIGTIAATIGLLISLI